MAELADIAGFSKSACWRRIQKLEEEGVIRQRVTLLDPVALNQSLTVFIGGDIHMPMCGWCWIAFASQGFATLASDRQANSFNE